MFPSRACLRPPGVPSAFGQPLLPSFGTQPPAQTASAPRPQVSVPVIDPVTRREETLSGPPAGARGAFHATPDPPPSAPPSPALPASSAVPSAPCDAAQGIVDLGGARCTCRDCADPRSPNHVCGGYCPWHHPAIVEAAQGAERWCGRTTTMRRGCRLPAMDIAGVRACWVHASLAE